MLACGITKSGKFIAWPVVYYFDGFRLGGGKYKPSRPNKGFWSRTAVIGNIYENPELLEKEAHP
jgi:hypothetical protein